MRTNLLWVYEGLTEYLGFVLAARSGFFTPEQFQGVLASIAEWAQNQRGRSWRSLEDTAVASQLLFNARPDWAAWRRGVDFYDEGLLIWLDADTIIRQQTQGQRSLDDLCRRFFGKQSGSPTVESYTLDDIVAALNDVAPYDWKSLLIERLTSTTSQAPIDGIERSGWHIAYSETQPEYEKMTDTYRKQVNLSASIGVWVNEDGTIIDIVSDKTADRAGIGPGMKLIAVNSRLFSLEVLQDAIKATKKNNQPLEFLMENGGFFTSYPLDYHEGEKYPKLEQDSSQTDLITQIIKPLAPTGSESKP
jgi:predicted metalloprotease with PDZ domain